MRAVLQRVTRAEVQVGGEVAGRIETGWLVLLGVAAGDTEADAAWMAEKVLGLRAFADEDGKMNRDVVEVGGGILAVSQFTLLGDCRKGRRPGFTDAAPPELAELLYQRFISFIAAAGVTVAQGVFRAHMLVSLTNDGPVTLLLDSRKLF
jgi:D-tyrosyl-tRNA(Tyr) deacylase